MSGPIVALLAPLGICFIETHKPLVLLLPLFREWRVLVGLNDALFAQLLFMHAGRRFWIIVGSAWPFRPVRPDAHQPLDSGHAEAPHYVQVVGAGILKLICGSNVRGLLLFI